MLGQFGRVPPLLPFLLKAGPRSFCPLITCSQTENEEHASLAGLTLAPSFSEKHRSLHENLEIGLYIELLLISSLMKT